MKVSGVVFRSIPNISGVGVDAKSQNSISGPCFIGARGHFVLMTSPRDLRICAKDESTKMIRCGGEKEEELQSEEKKMKKRLKLLKGLSKDISKFSGMGYGLDSDHNFANQVKKQMLSEAADMLLAHLQQLKAVKKEIKRQRKEHKSELKASCNQNKLECKEGSRSCSGSCDSECGKVVDASHLKTEAHLPNEQQEINEESITNMPNYSVEVCGSQISKNANCSVSNVGNIHSYRENSLVGGSLSKKIEVCMGGKCKKLGAAALLDEFQTAVGNEGSVVGCKCMGKCRSAPNVKISNSIDGIQAEVIDDDSVTTPVIQLCTGVGLEDVGTIVLNFLGRNQKDLGLAASS